MKDLWEKNRKPKKGERERRRRRMSLGELNRFFLVVR